MPSVFGAGAAVRHHHHHLWQARITCSKVGVDFRHCCPNTNYGRVFLGQSSVDNLPTTSRAKNLKNWIARLMQIDNEIDVDIRRMRSFFKFKDCSLWQSLLLQGCRISIPKILLKLQTFFVAQRNVKLNYCSIHRREIHHPSQACHSTGTNTNIYKQLQMMFNANNYSVQKHFEDRIHFTLHSTSTVTEDIQAFRKILKLLYLTLQKMNQNLACNSLFKCS